MRLIMKTWFYQTLFLQLGFRHICILSSVLKTVAYQEYILDYHTSCNYNPFPI